ncbi:MAG: iron-sulfur cluster assembly accessory protein [Betaproteobacteria bacterium]
MSITLTENAALQIKRSLAKRGKGVGLRLGVKTVGCSGLAYTFDYADDIGADDAHFESHDATVVIDKEALKYLDGTTVDFARDGLKESFKFENPNAKNQCGCGESFSI